MSIKRVRQPKDEPRLLKEHAAAYRALLDLLIRQVEREVREELARKEAKDQESDKEAADV